MHEQGLKVSRRHGKVESKATEVVSVLKQRCKGGLNILLIEENSLIEAMEHVAHEPPTAIHSIDGTRCS